MKRKNSGLLGMVLPKVNAATILKAIMVVLFLMTGVTAYENAEADNDNYSRAGFGVMGIIGLCLYRAKDDEGGGGSEDDSEDEKKMLGKVKKTTQEVIESYKKANDEERKKLENKIEEQLKEIQKLQDRLKGSEEFKYKETTEELVKLAAEVKALKEDPAKPGKKVSLKEELKASRDKIKAIAKGTSSEEVVIKALTLRSAITDNETAYDLPDIGQLATRKLSLYEIFPKINLGIGKHNGTIRYYDWDEDTIARAAAAVAEGAAFPESTAKWKKGSVILQKIGDTLPVTEEFLEDETLFAAELEMFLNINVALEMDRQLADGDGTGNTIIGLKASVDAYTLPVTGSVVNPSIYDLIVKLSEAITTTGGAKYAPDFVVMNIADINKMKLTKDANYNYVLPPFVDRNGNQVAGITVFESNIITADTLVIGDRRFARIYELGGITLTKGMINAQFTEDEMTLKARKRMAFLIRSADKGGFLKVTSITAALEALAIA